MFCPNCGSQLLKGAQFCQACGAKITPTEVVPATRATVPPGTVPAPSRPTPNRRPLILLILLALGLCVCVQISNSSRTETGNGATSATQVATQTPPSQSSATYVDPRELAANPSRYKGSNIYIQGKALTVEQRADYTWIQVMAEVEGRGVTESVVAEVRPKFNVLRDDCVRIYGVAAGTQQVRRTLTGAENNVPLINGYLVTSLMQTRSGICQTQ